MTPKNLGRDSGLAALRRLAQRKDKVERCDFCDLTLHAGHRHLLEIATRKIICACDGCALRFENVTGRYKLIPREARGLSHFKLTEAQWENLALPINLAFFFHSTPANKVLAF